MNHKDILKRAWSILWSYKTLWVFGIILGLTTASGGQRLSNYTSDRANRANQTTPDFLGKSFQEGFENASKEFEKLFTDVIPAEWVRTAIIIGITLGCLILLFIIASTIFRYLSRTALIRMVDDYEETDTKATIRQGFRIGWSRKAWRLFLIDLLIWLPVIVAFIVLFLIIFAPLLFWATDNVAAGILGTVMTIGLFVLGIFLAIVITAALRLLLEFFWRAAALEDLGVVDAIKYGFRLVKENLAGVGLMWLIILGVNIGYTIIMIPVVILVMLTAGVISGVIGLIAAGTIGLITSPLVVGLVVGSPIFILLMVIPLAFVDGLRQTYLSSAWTLTFRELRSLEKLAPKNDATEPDFEAGEANIEETPSAEE
jgi:hypothetical protein